MNRRRVLHISTSFPLYKGHPSGWFVFNQVRPLPDMGWDTTVLAPHAKGAALSENMDGIHVKRYRYMNQGNETVSYGGGIMANLRADKKRWLFVPPFFGFGAASTLKHASQADLLHAHWSFAGLMAYSATRVRVKPFVVTFHGSDVMGASGPMKKAAKFVAGRAARIIVHSQAMKDAAGAFADRGKIEVIPHGVDVNLFQPADPAKHDGRLTIVGIGRLTREKGFDVLLSSLAQLKDNPDWRCVIMGEGPMFEHLRSQARGQGIESRITLTGEVPHHEMAKALARSHIGVVPSRREGFGVACAEMSAAGLPVVATKSGGIEDIVAQDQTGLLVPVDQPKALAGSIDKLLRNKSLRKILGANGRKRITNEFSVKASAVRLVKIYEDVLSD